MPLINIIKISTLLSLFFGLISKLNAQIQVSTKDFEIEKFETHIGSFNKIEKVNFRESIKIETPPTLISIVFKTKTKNLKLKAKILEDVKMNESFDLFNTNNLSLFNLASGSYTLTIFDVNNENSFIKIPFSIKSAFYEKWWFSPVLFLILLIFLSALFYLIYGLKLRSELKLQALKHELDIKVLRTQMNPHFIFNSLNSIDSFILRKKFIEASDSLQKFSKLTRQILENSENQTIDLVQELETLKLYIDLEQERFDHSFDYKIIIELPDEDLKCQIPPLLIQPFVENAILHGIRHLTGRKGKVIVKVWSSMEANIKLLHCVIKDNGIGREKSKEINESRTGHKSMGMQITLERIKGFQSSKNLNAKPIFTDLYDGTQIEFVLPLLIESRI